MARTWKVKNSKWQYFQWNDNSIRSLIKRYHPELLHVYCGYEEMVARADIGRYAILDVFGGIYADMDTICVRPIHNMLCSKGVSLYVQLYDNPICTPSEDSLFEHVANSVIAVTPRHLIWQDVFEKIIQNKDHDINWLQITGPPMFSKCVKRYTEMKPGDVHFLNRRNIITAFYMPKYYMRWYGLLHKDICVLDFNESARQGTKKTLRQRLWPNKS